MAALLVGSDGVATTSTAAEAPDASPPMLQLTVLVVWA